MRRITDDNRLDLSLQQEGLSQVRDSAQELLDRLEEAGGTLDINDDTPPEVIHRTVGMSKKVFKRSVGMLLKSGRIEMDDRSIRLIQKP